MSEVDCSPAETAARALTSAWNSADATAFAREFSQDADFVNIFAMYIAGREGIANQHQFIFETIYRGSRVRFTVAGERTLPGGALLARLASELHVPHGPMTGTIRTLATAVLEKEPEGWRIVSFHNTLEQPPPGLHN